MRYALLIVMAVAIGGLNGCSKDENLDPALYATWQVTKVEGLYYWNGVPAFPVADNNPTGTVEFNSDGTGYQNYMYQIGNNSSHQVGAFTWQADDSEIRIVRVNEPNMVWARVANLTNKQVATYTHVVDANSKWDYTLTLEK